MQLRLRPPTSALPDVADAAQPTSICSMASPSTKPAIASAHRWIGIEMRSFLPLPSPAKELQGQKGRVAWDHRDTCRGRKGHRRLDAILPGEESISIVGIATSKTGPVEIDPLDRHRKIRLFAFERHDPKGERKPFCKPGHDGRFSARVIGDFRDPTRIITCAFRNYGKCPRFGYAPCRTTLDGRPMAFWHSVCLKMLPVVLHCEEMWAVNTTIGKISSNSAETHT